MKLKTLLILLITCFLGINSVAQEVIKELNVDINVSDDRSMTVTENILIHAEGESIKRGIYRDIPLSYINPNGVRLKYDLDVLEVLKDSAPEPYRIENMGGTTRIYIGDENIILDPGDYNYQITFRLSDQVRFFEDYDEIYYNAIGGQWAFNILKASATVHIPQGAEVIQYAAYSGYSGESDCDCSIYQPDSSSVVVNMVNTMPPGYYLTVSVGFSKGIVEPPSEEELKDLEKARTNILDVGLYGTVGILLIYLITWFLIGRDPAKGTIIPIYDPPKNLSPAACRTVLNMKYDKKGFTSSLVNMAIKGALIIDKEDKPWYKGGDKYKLIKTGENMDLLTKGETEILEKLMPVSNEYEIKSTNYHGLMKAIEGHEKYLRKEYNAAYYKLNRGWLTPPILLSIALVITLMVLTFNYDETTFFGEIISLFALVFIFSFTFPIFRALKNAHGGKKIFLSLLNLGILGFVGFQIYGLRSLDISGTYLDNQILFGFPAVIVILIVAGIVFNELIKAPSHSGRRLMDQIEGLRMYLATTEEDRLSTTLKKNLTIQHFEEMLPFAIALDVEKNWSDKFESIIDKAIEKGTYRHTWYHSNTQFNTSSFTNDISRSFSSAVSSNSNPPSSSSSGSGGGGSSGGGSGGGGGGGW